MKKAKAIDGLCRDYLREAMDYNDLPGLAIGVTLGGEEWTGAAGVRDVTTKDPMTPEDIFHCASVSKLFTATAVMRLAEAGLVGLDDRLCDLMPDLKIEDGRFRNIRLRHMLSHTSGIDEVSDFHWAQALTGRTALADYVYSDEVRRLPLLGEPGEAGFHYSDIAFEILGRLVEERSGTGLSYEDYVAEYLMAPAGMSSSTMLTFARLGVEEGEACPLITEEIRRRNREAGRPGRESDPAAGAGLHEKGAAATGLLTGAMALPHEKREDRTIVPVRYYPYTRPHAPSSTLTSNVGDLLRWARINMEGFARADGQAEHADGAARPEHADGAERPESPELAARPEHPEIRSSGLLMSPGSYRLCGTPLIESSKKGVDIGLGWFTRRQKGYRLYGHEGTDDGFRASFWICPELELGIAVLCNLSKAPAGRLNQKLFDRLLDGFDVNGK